jgi:hypothetical protein
MRSRYEVVVPTIEEVPLDTPDPTSSHRTGALFFAVARGKV